MAVYCMSDIHGCYDMFIQMLRYIRFTKEDELYIIGDLFDRGEKSYEIYNYVKTHDNVHVLKGNHEDMAFDALTYGMDLWVSWFHRNGGIYTYHSFLRNFSKYKKKYMDENTKAFVESNREMFVKKEIITFCKSLPLYKYVEVNGRKFLLVHAGIAKGIPVEQQSSNTVLWIRDIFYYNPTDLKDTIVIFGHTPTYFIAEDKSTKIWVDKVNKDKIGIDGGCFFVEGHINCIRLDDMMGFSIARTDGEKSSYPIKFD